MFLTAKELAKKWGVDQSRVLKLAREGRIEGAQVFGNSWMFPEDAVKPRDGRRRENKGNVKENQVGFRFPLFVNFSENYYDPPLSKDERLLRQAQIEFCSCNMKKAEEILTPLLDKTENIYVKISALYFMYYVAIYNKGNYERYANMMNHLLAQNFDFKKEMMLFKYNTDIDLGYYGDIFDGFYFDCNYKYHPSAYYASCVIAFMQTVSGDFSLISKLRFDAFDLICQRMEDDGYFWEAQKMHYMLLVVYQARRDEEKMMFHIRRALKIAYEHDLIFCAASNASYYLEITNKALEDFPVEFGKKVLSFGKTIHERFVDLEKSSANPSYLGVLSKKEFELAFLANQGYTNREISAKIGMSEKMVSKKYNEIYDKLGAKNKKELIEIINETHRKKLN